MYIKCENNFVESSKQNQTQNRGETQKKNKEKFERNNKMFPSYFIFFFILKFHVFAVPPYPPRPYLHPFHIITQFSQSILFGNLRWWFVGIDLLYGIFFFKWAHHRGIKSFREKVKFDLHISFAFVWNYVHFLLFLLFRLW